MNILNSERGVAITFVAMGLFLFMLFLGVALDTGWTVYVRSQGQARVDASALAAASGLFSQNTATRETEAKNRAETFSDTENPVLTTDTDPTTDVIPMHYNPATQALTDAPSWAPPPNGDFTQPGANAVRVDNAVPTPLFFSGIRNVFGAAETGQTDINVSAVGFLGCPGGALVSGPGFAPIALRACRVGFPGSCGQVKTLWQSPDSTGSATDNSAFTTLFGTGTNVCRSLVNGTQDPTQVAACDPPINLVGSGQTTDCLCELRQKYIINNGCNEDSCTTTPPDPNCTATLPVVDTGCAGDEGCGTPEPESSRGQVVGWASICFTEIVTGTGCGGGGNSGGGNSGGGTGGSTGGSTGTPNKWIKGALDCGKSVPGTNTGTQCFGTIAQNPILIR
ncbi:MAG: pilus assembly protein TadG-related protein [Candidatus Binatia bacterium]